MMLRFVNAIGILGLAFGATLVVAGASGCGGQQTPAVKTYEVKMPGGVEQAKQLLKGYAQGQPVGSEAMSYPKMVEEAKKTDPQKAAILEKGLEEIKKNPAKRASVAKELLQKL